MESNFHPESIRAIEEEEELNLPNLVQEEAVNTSSEKPAINYLEEFRQQWQDELEKTSHSRSSSPHSVTTSAAQPEDAKKAALEHEARSFFLQGMEAEDNKCLTEAIYYYRKALQLVPDIESKLGPIFNSTKERDRQDSESSVEEPNYQIEDLVGHFENISVGDQAICQPSHVQRMMHFSSLPIELVVYILHWLVGAELDVRSLEMFSMVCRGFYRCARDERLWKLVCKKVWGANLGSAKKYGGCWRRMLLERPHLLYEGCYICRTTYVRQGERGLDQFYQPYHLVEYYRYIRFFPDGQVLMCVSPEEPQICIHKLRHKSGASGMLRGGYRLSDTKVTLVLKRVRSEPPTTFKYRRRRQQQQDQNEVETYVAEFELSRVGKRSNVQLVWTSYCTKTKYLLTGEEKTSNFTLSKKSFPSLIFSRVRSFTSTVTEPLV